jgi:hypothetical protein
LKILKHQSLLLLYSLVPKSFIVSPFILQKKKGKGQQKCLG